MKYIMDNNEQNLKEKIVCKKCGNIVYRDLEKYEIYSDVIDKEEKYLYAIYVKKFKCPKCKSTEYNSYICDMNTEDSSIINVDLTPAPAKKTRKKVSKDVQEKCSL